jgi:hypothetical protein
VTRPPLFGPRGPVTAGVPGPETPAFGPRRRLVLLAATFTTVIEALVVTDLLPTLPVGGIQLSLAIIPALGLAVVCGDRLVGRSSHRRAALVYWVMIAAAIPALLGIYLKSERPALFVALVSASLGEELVYRLAIPAVIAAFLRYGKVRVDKARMISLALAGLWFVLLPGHREQMHNPAEAIPFLAFALLSAVLVYRSGSVLPMAAGHAVTNLLTVLVWNQTVAADARGMSLACVLGLLVLAYGRPRRLTLDDDGGMLDTVTGLGVAAIDLRDGHPAAVILTDGTALTMGPGDRMPRLPMRSV